MLGLKSIHVWKSSVLKIIETARSLTVNLVFTQDGSGFIFISVLVRTLSSHPTCKGPMVVRAPQPHGGQADAAGSLCFPAAEDSLVPALCHPECLFPQECQDMHGEFTGSACGHHGPYTPDVLFWSCILFFTTFILSSTLKTFKTSRYFPTRVGSTLLHFLPDGFQIVCSQPPCCWRLAGAGLQMP